MSSRPSSFQLFRRWLGLVLMAGLSLQLFFAARIAVMAVVDPQSTTFQRSEMWRIATTQFNLPWAQAWVPYEQISNNLKAAVITAEDDGFTSHNGVDWDALEKAWKKNAKAKAKVDAQNEKTVARLAAANSKAAETTASVKRTSKKKAPRLPTIRTPKIIGGSTISQQLAKNLLLSGERSLLRKGQEIALTYMLEGLLSKERILEIYLNNVEWGEGVFGAEAAARHYFHKPAAKLGAFEAARLAVMLPRPKYFEKMPGSSYIASRTSTIAARMGDADLP